MAKYEVRLNKVIRDGLTIGEFTPDGAVSMYPGYENYRMPASRVVSLWIEKGDPGEWTGGDVQKKIRTVRDLVSAMNEFLPNDRCPAMSPLEGDYTPGVVAWIKRHDDVRRQVLKKYKGNESC